MTTFGREADIAQTISQCQIRVYKLTTHDLSVD